MGGAAPGHQAGGALTRDKGGGWRGRGEPAGGGSVQYYTREVHSTVLYNRVQCTDFSTVQHIQKPSAKAPWHPATLSA